MLIGLMVKEFSAMSLLLHDNLLTFPSRGKFLLWLYSVMSYYQGNTSRRLEIRDVNWVAVTGYLTGTSRKCNLVILDFLYVDFGCILFSWSL